MHSSTLSSLLVTLFPCCSSIDRKVLTRQETVARIWFIMYSEDTQVHTWSISKDTQAHTWASAKFHKLLLLISV